jgi:hypothetical protein
MSCALYISISTRPRSRSDARPATILGRTPTTLAEWLDAADLSSLDPQ